MFTPRDSPDPTEQAQARGSGSGFGGTYTRGVSGRDSRLAVTRSRRAISCGKIEGTFDCLLVLSLFLWLRGCTALVTGMACGLLAIYKSDFSGFLARTCLCDLPPHKQWTRDSELKLPIILNSQYQPLDEK